jgi:hypothetical protein
MPDMSNGPILTSLNYLFSHEGGRAVAHCLELDIVASGPDRAQAEDSLDALVLVQIASCFRNGNWTQLKVKAPFEFWQAIEDAKSLEKRHLEVEVPPIVLPVERHTVALPVVRYEKAEAVAA